MKSTKIHPRPDWFQFMLCKCQFKLHGDLVCKVCVSHLTEFVFHVPWYLKRVKNWSLLTALKITTKYCMLQIVVYNQNLVLVSATETKIKFRYWYRSLNFFCLNRNFLHCLFSNYSHTFCALFWIFARSYRVIMMLLYKLSGILIKNAKLVTKTHIWPKKIVSGKAVVMKHRKEVNK